MSYYLIKVQILSYEKILYAMGSSAWYLEL